MDKKIRVTVSLFFKIIGSEMVEGETLYCESKIDLKVEEDLSGFDLQKYAKILIKEFAELFKVSEENIRIVSRQEYEENTKED